MHPSIAAFNSTTSGGDIVDAERDGRRSHGPILDSYANGRLVHNLKDSTGASFVGISRNGRIFRVPIVRQRINAIQDTARMNRIVNREGSP